MQDQRCLRAWNAANCGRAVYPRLIFDAGFVGIVASETSFVAVGTIAAFYASDDDDWAAICAGVSGDGEIWDGFLEQAEGSADLGVAQLRMAAGRRSGCPKAKLIHALTSPLILLADALWSSAPSRLSRSAIGTHRYFPSTPADSC